LRPAIYVVSRIASTRVLVLSPHSGMNEPPTKSLTERITGARNMQSRYAALVEVTSGKERERFEMLAKYWRDAAELLEMKRVQAED